MNQDFREKFVAIMQNLKNSFDRILIKQIVPADLSFFCDFLDCSLHIGQDENLATVTVKRIFELNEIIFIKQLINAHPSKRDLICSFIVQLKQKCGNTKPLQSLIVFNYFSFKSITLKHGNYVSPSSYYERQTIIILQDGRKYMASVY